MANYVLPSDTNPHVVCIYTMSKSKKWYCEKHKESIPEDDKTDFQKGKEIDPLDFLFGNLE